VAEGPSPTPKKRALGRGLGALIGEGSAALARAGTAPGEGRLRDLPLEVIAVNRRQPRRAFDPDELAELATSIKALGVVQPVVVRPLARAGDEAPGGGPPADGRPVPRYELIAGERRLRAARLAGLDTVPALVRPADEAAALEIALAENVAREDLNAIEEAQAYASLVDEFGLTHERVGELVGRSRVSVTNTLRLLELPDDVQRLIESGALSEGHGRALLGLSDHGRRRSVAALVRDRGLSVRETEALVRKLCATPGAPPLAPPASDHAELAQLVDDLYGVLEAPVAIRQGKRGGTIRIAYRDQGELDRLVALLKSLGR
jgi:ParB family transcriptional regulator, chromosome partitioning protein